MSDALCHKCSNSLNLKVGQKAHRSDTCPSCKSDIKCCKNCTHYNINAYNQCKENQAERQVDKERSNFCEFFNLGSGTGNSNKDKKLDTKSKLDSLFKS